MKKRVLTISMVAMLLVVAACPPSLARASVRAADSIKAEGLSAADRALKVSNQAVALLSSAPQAQRIQFARDATSGTVYGSLAAGSSQEYVLRAMAGQLMKVMLSSTGGDAVLEIYGLRDGAPLVRSHMRQTSWQGYLRATQDYSVKVISTGNGGSYTLEVVIPERVRFVPGAFSATRYGRLQPGETHEYLLRARRGQIMTVTVQSPNRQVWLEIYGVDDGQPLARVALGQTRWSGVLPGTQDYGVKAVSMTDARTSYAIKFVIK
jgi:hypothetical protein